MLTALAARIPETDAALHGYIEQCLGFSFARRAVCEEHSAPFQFIADLYFNRVQRAIELAPRGGGKTRATSILEWLKGGHGKAHMFHAGGIDEQAKRGYGYVREYIDLPQFAGVVDPRESLMSMTKWANGSVLEVHAATMNQTSGAHPDLKVGDELEKWRYDVYQQFLGMGTAEDVQTVFISTREKAFGLMQTVLDEAAERDIKVYSYCVWETKVRCPVCTKGQCPLWEPCQGRYKDSDGHRSVKNITDKFLLSSEETWASQHLCLRPGSQGVCFPNLVTEPGEPDKSNVSEAAIYDEQYPIVVACDDNTASPRAILYCQEGFLAGVRRVWAFGQYYEPGRLQSESVKSVLEALPKRPEYAVVPPEATALRISWQQQGIPTVSPKNYRRVEGVNIVNRFIRDANGQRVFVLHPNCRDAIRSLRNAHKAEVAPGVYSDEPVKGGEDHFSDAISYYLFLRRYEG